MRRIGRSVSVLLILCLVISMVPMEALAGTEVGISDWTEETVSIEDIDAMEEEETAGEEGSEDGSEEATEEELTEEELGALERGEVLKITFYCTYTTAHLVKSSGMKTHKLTLYARAGEAGLYENAKCTKPIEEVRMIVDGMNRETYGDTMVVWRYTAGGESRFFTYEEVNKQIFTENTKVEPERVDGFKKVISDAFGNETTTIYNRDGNPTSVTNALGYETKAEYTKRGSIAKEITALGYETTYTYQGVYNGKGQEIGERLVKKEYPDKTSEEYEYDSKGRLAKHKNADGTKEEYTYDDNDMLIKTTTYDSKGKKVSVVKKSVTRSREKQETGGMFVTETEVETSVSPEDEEEKLLETVTVSEYTMDYIKNPAESDYQYGKKHGLEKQTLTDTQGQKVTYKYEWGNVVEAKTKYSETNYSVTNYSYETYQQKTYLKKAETTYIEETAAGERKTTKETDVEYEYEYEYIAGEKILTKKTEKDRAGHEKTYEYDKNENLLSYTDANGNTTRYEYDGKNQLKKIISPIDTDREAVTEYEYDKAGQLIQIIDPEGGITSYEYDRDGRKTLEKVTDPDTKEILVQYSYDYDSKGRCTVVYDKGGQIIESYRYDDAGNITSVKDGKGNETKYSYDAFGNVLSVTDGEGNTQKNTYNEKGERVSYSDALGRSASFVYNENGQLIKSTDKEGNETTFEYDEQGRQKKTAVKIENYNEITTEFEYDKYGNVIKVTNDDGSTVESEYYKDGNLKSTKDALGNVEKREYDNNGNLTKVIEVVKEEGKEREIVTKYEYDKENRQTKVTDSLGGETEYEYDKAGNLTAIISKVEGKELKESISYDKAGRVIRETNALAKEGSTENTVSYEYGNRGEVTKKIHEDGKSYTAYKYDLAGNLTEERYVSGAMQYIHSYTYNKNNQVLTEKDPGGRTVSYTYTKTGVVETETDSLLGRIRYEYDKNDNVTLIEDQEGGKTSYTYNKQQEVATVTDPNGNVYKYHYDYQGNVVKAENPDGGVEKYTYDSNGQLKSYTDSEGYRTSYEYDQRGNQTLITDPKGNETRIEYDHLNRKTAEVDAEKGRTEYFYDSLSRVIKVTDPDGGEIAYEYDDKSRVVKESQKIDETETLINTYTYDAFDRVVTETDGKGITRSYEYDGLGNVTKYIDGEKGETKYQYNFNGQKINETDPEGNTYYYMYDKLGRLMQEADGKGNTVSYEYDKKSQLVTVIEGTAITRYEYDENGNQTKKTDAKGTESKITYDSMNRPKSITNHRTDTLNGIDEEQVTSYDYDRRGLVTKETNSLGWEKNYTYDENGNLERVTDEEGQETSYTYTALNLVETVSYEKSKAVKYTYDKTGALIKMEDQNGTTDIKVDLLDRIISVTDHEDRETKYSYDKSGNLKTVTYPDKESITYEYDNENRVKSVTGETFGEASYSYDRSGRVTEKTYPNGERQTYSYDELSNLTSTNRYKEGETLLYSTKISYDKRGNRTQTVKTTYDEAGGAVEEESNSYTYDSLNRLTSSQDSSGKTHYEYDSLGNLIKETEEETGQVIKYHYNELNQLVEKETGEDTYTYEYDKRGNRTTEKSSKGQATYTYDIAGRLVEGVSIEGETSLYEYNGLDMRVSNTTTDEEGKTVEREYVIDYTDGENDDLMVYYSEKGEKGYSQKNIYGAGERIGQETQGSGNIEEILYVHEDIMGSGSYYTTKKGELFGKVSYGPWGEVKEIQKSQMAEKREATFTDEAIGVYYTGHSYDQILEIYHAEARFYDPENKIFMSQDPVKDGANWYQYCSSNPTTYFDPTGTVWSELLTASGCFGHGEWMDEEDEWLTNNPAMAKEFMVGVGFMCLAMLTLTLPFVGMILAGAALGAAESAIDYWIEQDAAGENVNAKGMAKAILKGAVEGAITGGIGGVALKGAEVAKLAKPLESCATTGEKVSSQLTSRWAKDTAYQAESKGGRAVQSLKRWTVSTAGNYAGGLGVEFADGLIDGKSAKESLGDALANSGQILFNAAIMSTVNTVVEHVTTPKCFVAGTLVLSDEGNVAIEDIEAGDTVYAYDEQTGQSAYKEVVQTFENTTDELTYVTVETEEGEIETITSTPGHPYYVEAEEDFVKAYLLEEGTVLTLADGSKAIVTEVITEELEEEVTVYNFEVRDFHTYYVGENSVLVHNMCDGAKLITEDEEFHPANSVAEAEEFAKLRFTRDGNGKVRYGASDNDWMTSAYTLDGHKLRDNVFLTFANAVNGELFQIYKKFPKVPRPDGIYAFNSKSYMHKTGNQNIEKFPSSEFNYTPRTGDTEIAFNVSMYLRGEQESILYSYGDQNFNMTYIVGYEVGRVMESRLAPVHHIGIVNGAGISYRLAEKESLKLMEKYRRYACGRSRYSDITFYKDGHSVAQSWLTHLYDGLEEGLLKDYFNSFKMPAGAVPASTLVSTTKTSSTAFPKIAPPKRSFRAVK